MNVTWNRRTLLRHGALAGLGLAVGCDSGELSSDTEVSDTDLPDEVLLSKEVYVQQLEPDSVRLRFETREDVSLRIVITDPDGVDTVLEAERTSEDLTYAFNWIAENDAVEGEGDLAGVHILHSVVLTDLVRGGSYQWTVYTGGGTSTSGRFTVSPPAGTAFSFGWIADTMVANTSQTIQALASLQPTVVIHGGDLVYQSHPYDTWVEFSRSFRSLSSIAVCMVCVGNHEFEDMNEVEVMFDRLYEGQGDTGDKRYFAFTYGAMRFIAYDSESVRYGDTDAIADQDTWLVEELAAADADPDIQLIVVGMHRPMFTLSKYWVEDPTTRDARHALFLAYNVDLVFCGHMHAYEHFEVDGIHYVVDGGGGALLYDPNEEEEAVAEARPEEVELQLTSERSYGYCLVDVAADGSWSLTRYAPEDGAITDSFSS